MHCSRKSCRFLHGGRRWYHIMHVSVMPKRYFRHFPGTKFSPFHVSGCKPSGNTRRRLSLITANQLLC
uniref:Uncharacterized protein n=1 Tax=Arundo donax TaxID=35708 RepID=A0A0A8ZCR2_ARUDO